MLDGPHWKIRQDDGVEYGPYPFDRLKTFAENGSINHTTTIAHDQITGGKWVSVAKFPPIADALPPIAPPPVSIATQQSKTTPPDRSFLIPPSLPQLTTRPKHRKKSSSITLVLIAKWLSGPAIFVIGVMLLSTNEQYKKRLLAFYADVVNMIFPTNAPLSIQNAGLNLVSVRVFRSDLETLQLELHNTSAVAVSTLLYHLRLEGNKSPDIRQTEFSHMISTQVPIPPNTKILLPHRMTQPEIKQHLSKSGKVSVSIDGSTWKPVER
jgi:hypothetical protein